MNGFLPVSKIVPCRSVLSQGHLRELAEQLVHAPGQRILPSGIEPLSVLDREEAVEKLFGCFKDAGDLNDRLRNAMKEDPEGKLLKFNSFVFDAN